MKAIAFSDRTHRFAVIALWAACLAINGVAQRSDARILGGKNFVLSDEAKIAGIDGRLKVSLTVDKKGTAKDIKILAGPGWPCGTHPKTELANLRDAVTENLSSAVFSPAMKDGKTVSSEIYLLFAIGRAYERAVKEREAEEEARSGFAPPTLIDQDVLNGRAVSLPKPEYSSSARSQRVAGSVTVEVLINEQGQVVLAGTLGGHPFLQPASRDAACKAKFSPTYLRGKPVSVTGKITYNFIP